MKDFKKTINLFKKITKTTKRIEYSEEIMRAVNDQSIKGLKIRCQGGYDWIDQKHCYLRLLLLRGQVQELETSSDLIAHDEYLYAINRGLAYKTTDASIKIKITVQKPSNKSAFASEKRLLTAFFKIKNQFENKPYDLRVELGQVC